MDYKNIDGENEIDYLDNEYVPEKKPKVFNYRALDEYSPCGACGKITCNGQCSR